MRRHDHPGPACAAWHGTARLTRAACGPAHSVLSHLVPIIPSCHASACRRCSDLHCTALHGMARRCTAVWELQMVMMYHWLQVAPGPRAAFPPRLAPLPAALTSSCTQSGRLPTTPWSTASGCGRAAGSENRPTTKMKRVITSTLMGMAPAGPLRRPKASAANGCGCGGIVAGHVLQASRSAT